MSQFFIAPPGGAPAIATSFVTDDGTAIPDLNELNILGGTTQEDEHNGIRTIASPDLGDTILIQLTNRFSINAVVPAMTTSNVLIFPLTEVFTGYRFSFSIISIDTILNNVCGYDLQATFKNVTGTAFRIQNPYIDADEDIPGNSVDMIASTGNAVLTYQNSTANPWNVRIVGEYTKV